MHSCINFSNKRLKKVKKRTFNIKVELNKLKFLTKFTIQ
jgi:hypothetical protein